MDYPEVRVELRPCDECRTRSHFSVSGYREQRIVFPVLGHVRQNLGAVYLHASNRERTRARTRARKRERT